MTFDTAIFYARREGEMMRVRWGGEAEYDEIVERGGFYEYHVDPPAFVPCHFVALARVEKNFDRTLGRSR